MSEVFCISREGSYSTTLYGYYVDDGVLDNTTQFSAYEATGGSYYSFKLPVGVFRYSVESDATYLSVIAKNNFDGCLVWYEGQNRHTRGTTDDNPNCMGTSFGVQKQPIYGVSIPFFNNIIDASNYSMGLAFDESNWVGGKPLTQPYTWESVQSISGKLGTVNLARIKEDYINDGEPVSGAAKSRFSNLKDGNKVSVLIENVLPDPAATGTDVTVKYDIPSLSSGSYTYCKLVAKKNSMPESVEDGDRIIDLDPTKASVTVTRLKGETKYYFEIFTQDSEGHEGVSNVKSITTGISTDIILIDNSESPMYLNENIDANSKWYIYGGMEIGTDYVGAINLVYTNYFMSTNVSFDKSNYKYLYVTGENLGGSGQNHHGFTCVRDTKITYFLDCYSAPNTGDFEPNDEIITKRINLENLNYDNIYITIFSSDSKYRVYRMWLSNSENP